MEHIRMMSIANADNTQEQQQRALNPIHAGVHVKVRSKKSTDLPLEEYHKNHDHNKSIGIQTTMVIPKFDKQILCHLTNASSSSETSVSNKYSTRTDDTSACNHRSNQNNNAKNTDVHPVQDLLSVRSFQKIITLH